MSDTPQLLLAHHLKALRLPTFLREYDKLARQCAAEGVDHVRYLVPQAPPTRPAASACWAHAAGRAGPSYGLPGQPATPSVTSR